MNPIPPDPKTVITEVKSLRQIITINAGSLQKLPKTRETSLALTKLEEGCMWLGKELQRIGDLFPDLLKDPYPTSKDPSVGTIDPPEPEVSSPPKVNLPDWLVRLVEERDQLLERITKLARFLSKQKGGVTIDTEKLRLLKDQIQVMDQYLAILETRIRLVPVDTRPVEGGQSAPEVCTGPCACENKFTQPAPTPSVEPSSEACDAPTQPVKPATVNTLDTSSPPVALNDQEMTTVAKYIRGEATGLIEPKHVEDAKVLAFLADTLGLRVMSSEDFATVRREITNVMRMVEELGASVKLTETVVKLDDIQRILDAWTPPGR